MKNVCRILGTLAVPALPLFGTSRPVVLEASARLHPPQAQDDSHAGGSGGLATRKTAAFDDYVAYQP